MSLFMRSTRTTRHLALGLCVFTALSTSFAQEILKIEDQGSLRSFVLAEDEVLFRGTTRNEARLKDDVEAALPGAKVLETRGVEALTKLDRRVNRQRAASRLEPMQQSAPEYYSEPVLYPENGIRTEYTRRYVGPRVLVKLKDGQTAEQLRVESGAASVEEGVLDGHALLTFRDGWQSLQASEALNIQGREARPLLRRLAQRMWVPDDPFFLQQWHLKNRGQNGGLLGADANVTPAWDLTSNGLPVRGQGVTVVVVDDSLQTTHPDLAPNTPLVTDNVHADFRDGGNDPAPTASDDAHGTSVAGVIAAKGNNTLGVTGAAPDAQLLGVRLIGGSFDAATARNALLWQPAGYTSSISNNSWGFTGSGMYALDPIERQALQEAATTRRGNLGQITLFAAANSDQIYNGATYTSQDANYQPFANSRFVIGVAACTNEGEHSYYSNRGASVLICAPSNGGTLGIVTTDNTGLLGYNSALDPGGQPANPDYTNSFGGTSSATPLTSGVVALMLSANPGLGYRDVMEILATSAKKIDAGNSDWVTNGAGFHFAHAYGAGMVDAAAAVARSLDWDNLSTPVQTASRTATNLPIPIPETPAAPLTRTFDFSSSANLRAEHVEVVIRATHGNRSDLEITLTSPSGTRSILNPIRVRPVEAITGDNDNDIGDAKNGGWTYMTTHHWGENTSGTWTLSARDGTSGVTGTLDSVQVRVYGTPAPNLQRVRFAEQIVTTSEFNGTVNLEVDRTGPTNSQVTVKYSVAGGTAVSGSDYALASGTLTFLPTESSKSIPLNIIDDLNPEGLENIYIILSDPTGASLGGSSICSVRIGANDGNFVAIAAADGEAGETAPGSPSNPIPKNFGSFSITRSIVTAEPLEVPFFIGGSAANGTDYETIPASVTIPGGAETAFVSIKPNDDLFGEGTESVTLSLAPPASPDYQIGEQNEATVMIVDDEVPRVILVTASNQEDGSVMETSATGLDLKVSRGAVAPTDLTVDLFIGGSAAAGTDYVQLPSSVTIPAGSAEKIIKVIPKDNDFFNPTRTVNVEIAPNSDYSRDTFRAVVVRITNDEPVPDLKVPSLTIASPKAGERFAVPLTTATGLARDNIEVASVQYKLNGSDWQPAVFTAGTGGWSANLEPFSVPGPNALEVRALDSDGNPSPVVKRYYTNVKTHTLTVNTVGAGTVKPGTGSFEVGQTYTLSAKAAVNHVFAGWSGDSTSTAKTLSFTMPDASATVTATFILNPFAEVIVGRYTGSVAGPSSAPETAGLLDVTVSKTGAFSGKLWYGGKPFGLKGEFNGSGRFVGSVKRTKKLPLVVDLTLNMDTGAPQMIGGSISGEAQSSVVNAMRVPYGKLNPVPTEYARSYTFYLPPKVPSFVPGDNSSLLKPHGHGTATLTVTSAGIVKWKGVLGDGTPATQTTALTAAKTWPLYLPLYKGTGYIGGDVTHDPLLTGSDLSATLDWVKPAAPTNKMFPNGFTIEDTSLIGANYTVPAAGIRVLSGYDSAPENSGPLSLVDGNLKTGLAKVLTLLPTNQTTIASAGLDKLKISIAPKTGVISGSFVFPDTNKVTPIRGVILQNKIGKGVGSFIGSSLYQNTTIQTGRLEFHP